MPDKFSPEKRSEIMASVKSKGSKMELKMMIALKENNLGFEYQPKLFGKPDFFVCPNVVIFCDSSFWHGRNWKTLRLRLKEGYWQEHIEKNRKRDRLVSFQLRKMGYIVLRFWDNQIQNNVNGCIQKIKNTIGIQKKKAQ